MNSPESWGIWKFFEGITNYIIMEKPLSKTLFIVYTFIYLLAKVKTQNQTRIVGNNMIVNWNFQLPAFETSTVWSQNYVDTFTGWNCSGTCQVLSFPYMCSLDSRYCIMASSNQVIDLESPTGAYNLSQTVTVVSNGSYQLSFLWLPPRLYALNNKSMAVFINSEMISNISLNASNIGITYWNTFMRQITIPSGINVLKFVMSGSNDGFGIILDDVQFKPVNYIANNSSNNLSSNSINNSSNNTNSMNTTNSTLQNNTNSTVNNASQNSSLNSNLTSITDQQLHQNSAIPQFFLQIMLNNSYVSYLNSIPGSRVFFSFLMNFYISFDRLQFYYYHHQNFTQYAQMFLSSVHYFQEAKGSFAEISIRMICYKYNKQNAVQAYLEKKMVDFQFKNRYRNEYIFQKGGKGDTFISSQLTYFYYQVPSILIIHALLWCLFCRVFNYRISRIFRKYCLMGTFFLAIMQGNIEEFIFYLFTDIQALFNSSFNHIIANVFSLFFGFLCCFFSFCILIILYGLYKKLVKYLVEDYKPLFGSMLCITLQSGIFPFISGIIHAYLYDSLLVLTILLVLMESIWIVFWCIFLKKKIFVYRRKAIINICNCILRIYLLISLYLYEIYGFEVINLTHYYFIIIFLSLWILQILITITIFVIESIHFFSTSCVQNKIRNHSPQERDVKRKETSLKVMQFSIITRKVISSKGACKSDTKHDKTANKLRIKYVMK